VGVKRLTTAKWKKEKSKSRDLEVNRGGVISKLNWGRFKKIKFAICFRKRGRGRWR